MTTTNSSRPDIVEYNAAGHASIREVLRLVLYLDKPHAVLRHAAKQTIEAFVDLISISSLRYMFDMEGEPQELDAESLAGFMSERFEGTSSEWPNETINLVGAGGNAPSYSLEYKGSSLSDTDLPGERGCFDAWVPREIFNANAERFEMFFLETARKLSACSGYISLALAGKVQYRMQALAKRYRALDIADPTCVRFDLGDRCPGSYWLNYLGPSLAARINTIEMAQQLGKQVVMEIPPGGGLLVRMGQEPILGDVDRQQAVAEYLAFARFMNARDLLHVPRRVAYFENEQGLADRDEQDNWHQRFLK